MKRKFAGAVTACLLAAFLMTGCGNGAGSESAAAVTEADSLEEDSQEEDSREADSREEDSTAAKDGVDRETGAEAEKSKEDLPETAGSGVDTLHVVFTEIFDPVRWTYPGFGDVRLLDRNYIDVSLEDVDAVKYPKLQESLEVWTEESRDLMYLNTGDLGTYVKEDYEEREDKSAFSPYFALEEPVIVRADSRCLSFLVYFSDYTGGSHGYYEYGSANFDTETGEEIELREIVRDWDGFKQAVSRSLSENYPQVMYEYNLSYTKEDDAYEDIAWTLGYNGITVYFPPYKLGSYADGSQMVTVGFADHAGMFEEKYTAVPDSYAFPMADVIGMAVWSADLDGDGEMENISCEGVRSADSYYMDSWAIKLNDMETNVKSENVFFSMSPYLVKTAGDRWYILALNTGEDDFGFARMFEITGGVVRPVKLPLTANLGEFEYTQLDKTGSYIVARETRPITDVNTCRMITKLDVLGSYMAYRSYEITEEGGIDPLENFYYAPQDPGNLRVLYSKKSVMGVKVDEDMKGTDPIEIPGAIRCPIYRTDGKSWLDFKFSEDQIVRIEIGVDWPQTVFGEDAEEVFENLLYAG